MNVLVFSMDQPFSAAQIAYAKLVAAQSDSSITFLFAASKKRFVPAGEAAIEAVVHESEGYKVDSCIKVGHPIDSLLEQIETDKFNLIILGLPERIGYTKRLLGTVPQRTIQRSRLPTLLVQNSPTKFNRMLICTGGLESAEKVIRTGALIAAETGARVTLLYISGSVPSMYTGLEEMDETLPELLEADTPLSRHLRRGAEILHEHGVRAELKIRHGVVTNGILREAVRGDYDLIVLGASGARNTLRGWIMGDITQEVVGNMPCPVLIVP